MTNGKEQPATDGLTLQLLARALQEGAHHLADALLHLGAQAILAHKPREHVQLGRLPPTQLDALHDAYEHARALLLELRGVAQEVALLLRGGRPFDALRVI
jgi:hypothetical protein